VLGFTGFVRDWHGLDKVIDDDRRDPPESRRHLLVVGDGPARAALEQQARELGIENRVTVHRRHRARRGGALCGGLRHRPAAGGGGYASPLKLFEYLALGKAIVGPAQPNIEEILSR
jgi:glycosyltransferase involved in cell wall biosynthesis